MGDKQHKIQHRVLSLMLIENLQNWRNTFKKESSYNVMQGKLSVPRKSRQ